MTEQTGCLVGARMLSEGDEIMIVNSDGTLIRMSESEIPCLSRVTKGVRLMRSADSKIVSFEKIEASDIDKGEDYTE